MHANAALLENFYSAFARRDAAAMAVCYHSQAHFTDAVFDLRGAQVVAMWRMLCERGTDLRVEHGGIEADERRGSAHWEAWYSFSATGRKVHNVIEAQFEFKDGLILRHVDRFGFWRWSRQALGAPGLLLGWSGVLRRKVQATAAQNLEKFAGRS
jgi:hypothetical protein